MPKEETQPTTETTDNRFIEPGDDLGNQLVNSPEFQRMIAGEDAALLDNPSGTITPGPNLMDADRPPVEEEPEDAVREEEASEEVEAEEVDIDEEIAEEETPKPKKVKEGGSEEAEIKRRELSAEELDSLFVIGKVNGEEKEFSLRDLLATQQTQQAAAERLDMAKEVQRQYQELVNQYQQQLEASRQTQPKEPDYDDYSTPEDRQLAEMRAELNAMRQQITSAETQRLSSMEDDMIRSRIKSHLGHEDMDQVAAVVQRVKTEDPSYGAIAEALFSGPPKDQNHMNQRVAFMDSLLIKAKSFEMPTIIEKAKEEGKKDLKREKKSKLASVETTQKVPDESRADKISKAAQRGERAMVELGSELFIKELFPDA